MARREVRGVTLIEVAVALALLGLLLALAFPRYQGATRDRQVVRAAEDIAQAMRYAQQQAVGDTVGSCEYQAVVETDHARVAKLSGARDPATGGCVTGATAVTVKRTDAFPVGVAPSPAPTTVRFIGAGRLPYDVTTAVSVTVTFGDRSRTVTVEPATGRVQINP